LYPSSLMTASTRRRVSGDTSNRPLTTLDTVGTETPATVATSAIVMRGGRASWTICCCAIAESYRNFRRRELRILRDVT